MLYTYVPKGRTTEEYLLYIWQVCTLQYLHAHAIIARVPRGSSVVALTSLYLHAHATAHACHVAAA